MLLVPVAVWRCEVLYKAQSAFMFQKFKPGLV